MTNQGVGHDRPRVALRAEPADDPALREQARRWADHLQLPDVSDVCEPASPAAASSPPEAQMLLLVTAQGLALKAIHGPESLTRGKPVRIDLHRLDTTTGQGRSLRQPLLRAVGIRKGQPYRPSVLDATAGFGEDAWLLASSGCTVLAVERDPVVAAMLEDAVARAVAAAHEQRAPTEPTASPSPGRIAVVNADSLALLEHLASGGSLDGFSSLNAYDSEQISECISNASDVIYIDPMFPAGRKAAERKAMLILRSLVGEDIDADALLTPARRAARQRVVVKRARRAAPLAGVAPAASHHGRAVRYDVYPSARSLGKQKPEIP